MEFRTRNRKSVLFTLVCAAIISEHTESNQSLLEQNLVAEKSKALSTIDLDTSGEQLNSMLLNLVKKQQLSSELELADRVLPEGPLFELGKQLFFSKSLSRQRDVACSTCHHPLLAGGDALSLPVGVDALDPNIIGPGRVHNGDRSKDPRADGGPNVSRHSPSTFNIALSKKTLFWDGRVELLAGSGYHARPEFRTPDSLRNSPDAHALESLSAAQAMFPLTSGNEMFGRGSDGIMTNEERRKLLERRLQSKISDDEEGWLPLFQSAFDDARDEPWSVITMERVGIALSHYQKSQLFVENPWFDYLNGNKSAIDDEAKKGAVLFFTPLEEGGYACNSCHSGAKFTDEGFHNIAVPQIGRGKDHRGFDLGRMLENSNPNDKYAFRTPSLLNVAQTGPWGHTGAFIKLQDIIRHHLEVETSVLAFDYSLQNNPQFTNLPIDSQRQAKRSTEVLDELRQTPTREMLSRFRFDPDHASYLSAFLRTLSDPCISNHDCLKPWLPHIDDQGPDGELLHGQFSDFNMQKITFQPPVIVQEKQGSDSKYGNWFTDVTDQVGLAYNLPDAGNGDEQHRVAGGVAVDDFDGDGRYDLFVSHSTLPGRLFRSTSENIYQDVTESALGNLVTRQFGALFFDYDNDGDKDLFLVEDNILDDFLRVYENLGGGLFIPDPLKAGISFNRFTHSLSGGDYDSDGDIDLYAAHWGYTTGKSDAEYLWTNNGDAKFVDESFKLPPTRISPQTGDVGLTFTPIFTDFDQDGDSDLLVTGDFLTSQILLNQAGEKFIDATNSVISDENGMGAALGDIDNDGDQDWFVTSIWNPVEKKGYVGGESGNRLYRNDGNGSFSDVTESAGVRKGYWGWGACMADFNNDGWLDIFHTNGMTSKNVANEALFAQFIHDPSVLFINNQDGTFTEQSVAWGLNHTDQGRGVSCFDYNQDGKVDILVSHSGNHPRLFRNNYSNENNYLSVKLRYNRNNIDGIGAKIFVTAGGVMQVREMRLGSNYLSNDPPVLHFGLGTSAIVDSIDVLWPDGKRTVLTAVAVNQNLEVLKAN